MAPRNGRYDDLAVDLAHDMGVLEQQMEQHGEVQNQHGTMLTEIIGKLDRKVELCKQSHDDYFEKKVEPAIGAATGPVEVVKRWKANPLVWALLLMVAGVIAAGEEWLRYTWNITNETRTRVRVVEKSIEGIPAKIDKILAQVKKNNGVAP